MGIIVTMSDTEDIQREQTGESKPDDEDKGEVLTTSESKAGDTKDIQKELTGESQADDTERGEVLTTSESEAGDSFELEVLNPPKVDNDSTASGNQEDHGDSDHFVPGETIENVRVEEIEDEDNTGLVIIFEYNS